MTDHHTSPTILLVSYYVPFSFSLTSKLQGIICIPKPTCTVYMRFFLTWRACDGRTKSRTSHLARGRDVLKERKFDSTSLNAPRSVEGLLQTTVKSGTFFKSLVDQLFPNTKWPRESKNRGAAQHLSVAFNLGVFLTMSASPTSHTSWAC